jgi:tRNA 2-selenouridine synthase
MGSTIRVSPEFFIQNRNSIAIIDVRSEGEYEQGHFPGAYSIPILNNEERAAVGTCYKRKGNAAAVLLGYELVGTKFGTYIQAAKKVAPNKVIGIYCWRGGLRSNIMASLLKSAGFTVYILAKGYKSYRHWALFQLQQPKYIKVLGGHTGSAKTEMLQWLAEQGEQVIDLEKLANHRGSAFGHIGLGNQPTKEHFENMLALEWSQMSRMKPLWLEDENRMIGHISLPDNVYVQIRESKLYKMMVPENERALHILNTYGKMPVESLAAATTSIKKRLGDALYREAISLLESGDLAGWLRIVLHYYDKAYEHGNAKRDSNIVVMKSREAFMHDILHPNLHYFKQSYILLGSNAGDRAHQLKEALNQITQQVGAVLQVSHIYETKAWGNEAQEDFLNQVICIETTYTPQKLLANLLKIEQQMGRVRHEKWAPRTIDLDILFYEDDIIDEPQLIIPHPFLHLRRFTLVPLVELAPQQIHPILKKTFRELLEDCEDSLLVTKFSH